jgi:hypothetical protein
LTTQLYVGGALPPEALYIERAADRQLVDALGRGLHCHVLAPRQVGKTSLRIRARRLLESDPGHPRRCAAVDFTALGTEVAETDEAQDRWYLSLAAEMGRGLGLPAARIAEHWKQHAGLRGVDRWARIVRDVLLGDEAPDTPDAPQIVFFFDEVNALLRLRFRGEWLGALRALHNERATTPRLRRLTFCLIGFARAEDLVPDMVNNPFDIAETIALEDFTRAELGQAEATVAARVGAERAAPLLDAVHAWTSGHPLMTVALLRAALEAPTPPADANALSEAVEALFPRAGLRAHPLLTAAATYLQSEWVQAPASRTQALYARLLTTATVPALANDPVQSVLRIAGVAAVRADRLVLRNRIYARALDAAWVAEHLGHRPLYEAAAAWDAAGRARIALPSRAAAADLLGWAEGRGDLTELETALIAAMLQARQRRFVGLVLGGSVLTVGLLAAGALAAITAFRLEADRQRNRAERIRDVTDARRAADEVVIRLAQTEIAARNSLDDAQRQQSDAESVLAMIRTGAPSETEGNTAVENLRAQVQALTGRAARLEREVDRARAAREAAERAFAAAAHAADSPSAPTPAATPPVPPVVPTLTPPSPPPTPPVAAPDARDAGAEATTAQVVQAVEDQQVNLHSEIAALDGDTSRVRAQLVDVMRAEVLTPRPMKPRPRPRPDTVEADLCVTAVSIAHQRLSADNRRLCGVAACFEARNPQDQCLADAPKLAELCP